MTLKEYIDNGGKYYQREHMGNYLWRFILKGLNHSGEPADWAKEEAQDIKDGKALVLCPKGVVLSQGIDGIPVASWGVRVCYPRFEWQNEPRFKNFREMALEEIPNFKTEE